MNAPVARTRSRNLKTEAEVKAAPVAPIKPETKVTASMRENASTFYAQNKIANAAKGKADKARKALYAEMKTGQVGGFDLEVMDGENKVILEIALDTPTQTYIDTAILASLVTKEQFDAIITASKTAVVDKVGNAIAVRCEKTREGTEVVNVKAKK